MPAMSRLPGRADLQGDAGRAVGLVASCGATAHSCIAPHPALSVTMCRALISSGSGIESAGLRNRQRRIDVPRPPLAN
jgi:hypothetical protein